MLKPEFRTKKSQNGNVSQFVIGPLLPSFGQTFGNALRRTLLSSIKGSSVSYVKISGVSHLFTTIKGIKESVLDLVLNLKQLRFEVPADGSYEVSIDLKGAQIIKGKNFKGDLSVVNPDIYIGEITDDKGKLEISLLIETGYGYIPSEEKTPKADYIAVDSFFSPIKNVNFKVEEARVGKKSNYDRLILSVETDGSVTAEKAIKDAASILSAQFAHLLSGADDAQEIDLVKQQAQDKEAVDKKLYEIIIDELNLPSRVVNALLRENIETVADLVKTGREKLIGLKGLGKKSIILIDEELRKIGVEFTNVQTV